MMELKRYHPFVITLYIFTLIGWNTLLNHPLVHMVILLVSWMFLLEFSKDMWKTIRWNLIMMLLLSISNPLFQHRGIYVIMTIWGTPITLESLTYGLDLGCMLSGILNLFRLYSYMIQTDQILYMMTAVSPNAAILCSLSLQQLTRLKRQYEDIRYARSLLQQPKGWLQHRKENVLIISALITWLMETSVETSLSMRSRGYGERKRSCYNRYQIEARDRVFLLFEVICILFSIYASTGLSFWWFPTFYMNIEFHKATAFCVIVVLFCAVPVCLNEKESAVWEDIESI